MNQQRTRSGQESEERARTSNSEMWPILLRGERTLDRLRHDAKNTGQDMKAFEKKVAQLQADEEAIRHARANANLEAHSEGETAPGTPQRQG